MNIFGWKIERNKPVDQYQSFTLPSATDGTIDVPASGGIQNYTLDVNGTVRSESDLIQRYRALSLHPEVDNAIDDIVNEAIITDDKNNGPVSLDLSEVELPENIKDIIMEEFDRIVTLLKFNKQGYEAFRNWYVDGRIFYYIIIDEEDPTAGIQELRHVDSLKLRKVREVSQVAVPDGTGITQNVVNEYYVYSETGFQASPQVPVWNPTAGLNTVRVSTDSIIHVTSGLTDQNGQMVLSYLHPAIKPLNQLRMLEDAVVIYRLVRAPARRAFKVEVGGLPKHKADAYVRSLMESHKNKLVYDQSTGQVRDERKYVTMLEDYWLPVRDGKGVEINTLEEGQNLGEMEDVNYFLQQLYKALKIPVTRIDPSQGFNLGRPSEITRDELKFMKFIARLRTRFSELFLTALERQLILRQVIAPEEWEMISSKMKVIFTEDNYFEEMKNSELLRDRAQTTQMLMPFVDIFVSRRDIWRDVWRLNDDQIEEKVQQINQDIQMFGPIAPEDDGI